MTEDRWTELDELLMDQATGGLDSDREGRLATLVAEANDTDPERFELLTGEIAAAWIDLVGEEEMPAGLAERLLEAAPEAQADDRPKLTVSDGAATGAGSAAAVTPGRGGWLGWAAAAAIAFAWIGSDGFGGLVEEDPAGGEPVASVPAEPTIEERWDEMAGGVGALAIDWTATEDPAAAGAGGAVLWDGEAQQGFMRFSGLEVNDPSVTQYQLWIFDGSRDDRYPVDGGVFDIPAGTGEVVVPIAATLDVRQPTLFAITVEQPGGVMVSDRERIVLVASVGDE